ncbi:MAG: DUF21 domain-containing protein [Planctomycetales bacterium]|nr:DUF21 domain-containing protein [Planctomycetales bacterium]
MILTSALVILFGISLSAFFSGSETGFYRVTKVRLASDAKSGEFVARALFWLANRSSLVVATVLIGNNIANYLVSLGLILLSQNLLSNASQWEAVLPVLLTPILFVYGELLPKYFYYQIPYRLLRRSAPLLLCFTVLFAPISMAVMLLEAFWQKLFHSENSKSAKSLERQELQRVLIEGQEAGVVLPVQRELAQNLSSYGVRPIRQFAMPLRSIPRVAPDAAASEIISLADKANSGIVGVVDKGSNSLAGCYIASDVVLASDQPPTLLPIFRARASDSIIQVLTRLQGQQTPLVEVVDASDRVLGIVTRERLASLILA